VKTVHTFAVLSGYKQVFVILSLSKLERFCCYITSIKKVKWDNDHYGMVCGSKAPTKWPKLCLLGLPFFHISVTVQKSTQDKTICTFIPAILLSLRHCEHNIRKYLWIYVTLMAILILTN